jgi:acetyl esterase/lipase
VSRGRSYFRHPWFWTVWLLPLAGFLVSGIAGLFRAGNKVIVYRDLPYQKNSQDPAHRLDVYLPPQTGHHSPVLVMVHGGAWISGGKAALEPLARNFAQQGVVAIVPAYRLSPAVRHPEHAGDLRDALAWTTAQADRYGFDPKKLFLLGHSAGAHLSAWIAGEKSSPAGFIGIAGIYDLPEIDRRWPGYDTWFLNSAFGGRGDAWKSASPTRRPVVNHSPWLLIHGEADELADVGQTRGYAAHLKREGVAVELIIERGMDHFGVLRDLGSSRNALTERILKFIRPLSAD